jgi:hypothetical protein
MGKGCGMNCIAIGMPPCFMILYLSSGIMKALKDGIESSIAIDNYFMGDKNAIIKFDQTYRSVTVLLNTSFFLSFENDKKIYSPKKIDHKTI